MAVCIAPHSTLRHVSGTRTPQPQLSIQATGVQSGEHLAVPGHVLSMVRLWPHEVRELEWTPT